MPESTNGEEHAFVVGGRLALPYQYFAGRTGSRFLLALRDEGKILGLKDPQSGQVFIPPRSHHHETFADLRDNWVELEPRGVVTNFTVVHYREDYQTRKPPYILALIKLHGADTALPHYVEGIAPDKMAVGLEVEAVFKPKAERTASMLDIDHFRPVR
jgi:uncharacterized OB-fold protein